MNDINFPELPDFPELTNPPKTPKKRGPKPGSKNKPKKETIPGTEPALLNKLVNNDIVCGVGGREIIVDEMGHQVDFKSPMSVKELKFLELLFSGEFNREQAMISAGYENMHPRARYYLAAKIIQKYEGSEGDHRKIFRAVGVGEVKVARAVLKGLEKSESEHVKYNYTGLAAKCLGLSKDVEQASAGVTVIIQAQDGSAQQINLNTQPPGEIGSYGHPQPAVPGKPIMITK